MSAPATPGEPPEDLEDADPALARERTDLAWTRSSISFAALGALLLKYRPAVAVPVLVFSFAIFWVGHLRRDQPETAPRRVLLVTVAVTTMALLALVLTLVGRGSSGIRLLTNASHPASRKA